MRGKARLPGTSLPSRQAHSCKADIQFNIDFGGRLPYCFYVKLGLALPGEAQCFYWSMQEFPVWFRMGELGWFVFGTLPVEVQEHAVGGLSNIFRLVLQFFFRREGSNFHTGVRLQREGVDLAIQGAFALLVQDEKAHKNVFSTLFAYNFVFRLSGTCFELVGTSPPAACLHVFMVTKLHLNQPWVKISTPIPKSFKTCSCIRDGPIYVKNK